MKKSKIIAQNEELFTRLGNAEKRIKELEEKLSVTNEQLKTEIAKNAELRAAAETREDEKAVADTSEKSEEPETPSVKEFRFAIQADGNETNGAGLPEVILDEDMQYAADTIGEIVIESAKYSDRLAEGGRAEDKELVNLILGKTEVSKSEILAIAKQDMPIDVKKLRIDSVKTATFEYFESVKGQKA